MVVVGDGGFIPVFVHNLLVEIGGTQLTIPIGFSERLGVWFNLLARAGSVQPVRGLFQRPRPQSEVRADCVRYCVMIAIHSLLLTPSRPSPNHPIRPRQNVRGNHQSDLLGGFEVDDQLELLRLLHRQVGRLGAFKILSTYVAARRSKSFKFTP